MIWNPWKEIKRLREDLANWRKEYGIVYSQWLDHNIALQDVIAEERPTSNATVKRMAKIAREALGK